VIQIPFKFLTLNQNPVSIHHIEIFIEVRQRARENLETNPCLAVGLFYTFSFIFLFLWLLKGRKARSYGIFPATGSATG